eukprot:CAMPEP_0196771368 /NCGR_PEP_ID=MMETSP1104-20130614/1648_1 /TAXON_ID=33652 /ORGANISM="Cafeteria sp., Strain Caron Lab Isolate" /LENGTH=144 /DNA_ID=CAMNT_0042141487 /DNA_START=31 /DNA_END=465 /DNA_ORIENTATION=+
MARGIHAALMMFHKVVALFCGLLAMFAPHTYEIFFNPVTHGTDDVTASLLHEVIQLYGALIFGQAVIVHVVDELGTPSVVRGTCRAYCVIFSATSVIMGKAMLFGSAFVPSAIVNLALFVLMAIGYGYCAAVPPKMSLDAVKFP